jgi:TonB-linked SusC/RagA family outer membrane protein
MALVAMILAIGTPSIAGAQNAVISGKVTSEHGQSIEGANVYISDLAISILTNAEGNFTINLPAARVTGALVNLRARAVGYQPQARPVRLQPGPQTVNFVLRQDINRLDEIVVTGSVEGVEKAKVPFAVGRLSVEDMPVPALDPLKQLAGKVAGVRVGQTSGRPGSTPEIMMRGPTSINGSGRGQGPLIIVDGAIMNIGSLEELGGLDIESVEVVKGAAGAAMYGTRAANGVITIKTKRGNNQEGTRFNVRQEIGYSDLNSLDWGQPENHQLQLDETGTRICRSQSGNVAPCSRTFDWMTEIMRINSVDADTNRTAQNSQFASLGLADLVNVYQIQQWPGRRYNILAQVSDPSPTTLTSLDASGKVGSVRYYLSGQYTDEPDAIKGLSGVQQRRGRVNLDYDARSDLLVSVSSMFSNGTRDNRTGNGLFGQLLRGSTAGTDYVRRDSLGRYLIRSGGGGLHTPTGNGSGTYLYDLENRMDTRYSNRFVGNITTTYFPVEWFTLEGVFAYDNRHRRDEYWLKKGYRTNTISASTNNGQMQMDNRDEVAFNTSVMATFRRQLRSDLAGKLQFRALYDESEIVTDGAYGEEFIVKEIYDLDNIRNQSTKSIFSSGQTIRNVGYFAGTNLDFRDKYILDLTFRYDGSSLFGAGNRYAPFGRVSGVWRVSQEDFWNVSWMDDFRVRASRGTAGSTPRFSAQYETYNVSATGFSLGQAGNSKLKPETTTEIELGSDFTLFNRLGVELTNARSKTEDQILLVGTPSSLGFSQQWKNAGTLENNTYEVALNMPVLNRRDMNWSMRGTWDRTRTFITELFAPEYVVDAGTGQGTSSAFRISASREKSNGFQINRFGNIWGRKFYKSCGDLPTSVQASCGAGKEYQVNDDGWVVWVGNGNSWTDGITKNLWGTQLAAGSSPWGVPLNFGHPIIDRPLVGQPGEGTGITQIIGNVMPDFRMTFSNTFEWKRLSVYGLLDGTFGHDIINQGEQWGLLDLSSAYFDQGGKSVQTAKPTGYGWRAGAPEAGGTGGFYDVLGPNNYSTEDGSFVKLREVSLSYRVGGVRGVGDWTVGLIGRNLWTATGYSGLDPEVGSTGGSGTLGSGSGLINQTDAFGFPTLRSFTLSLTTRF